MVHSKEYWTVGSIGGRGKSPNTEVIVHALPVRSGIEKTGGGVYSVVCTSTDTSEMGKLDDFDTFPEVLELVRQRVVRGFGPSCDVVVNPPTSIAPNGFAVASVWRFVTDDAPEPETTDTETEPTRRRNPLRKKAA